MRERKCRRIPICLLPLVERSNILLIILLIEAFNFSGICLLNPRSKTGRIVLTQTNFTSASMPNIIQQVRQISELHFLLGTENDKALIKAKKRVLFNVEPAETQ